MSLDEPVLKSRPPTKAVPYPFILVEGEEGSGKSWSAALLSSSEKVGATYWLELGETTADMYGAVPGARFEVLEHDGTYVAVLEQVLAVKAEAKRAHAAGEPPVVLVVDTMGNIWDGLKDWVSERAKAKPANQRKLAADPAADLDVSRNLWNDAGKRYRKLTTALLTFPGIVVGIAKGKEISDTDQSTGQPYKDGRKSYRIEGEKNLGYDATVIVRLTRGNPPLITKARSVHAGVRPEDPPVVVKDAPDNMLEWLTFDVLKADPHAAPATLVAFTGGDLLEDERADEAEEEAKQAPPKTRQQAKQPDPAHDKAAELDAQVTEWLTNLHAKTYDNEFLESVLAQAVAEGFADHAVGGVGPSVRSTVGQLIQANNDGNPGTGTGAPPETPPEPDKPAEPESPTPAPETPQEPAQAPAGLTAEDLAIVALEEHDTDVLRQAWNDAKDAGLLNADVLPFMSDDDRATLDVPPDAGSAPLGGLLQQVNRYVGKWGTAVRSPNTSPATADAWGQGDQLAPGEEPPPGWV